MGTGLIANVTMGPRVDTKREPETASLKPRTRIRWRAGRTTLARCPECGYELEWDEEECPNCGAIVSDYEDDEGVE